MEPANNTDDDLLSDVYADDIQLSIDDVQSLPYDGYRIFDQRPSSTERRIEPTYTYAQGYISFAPPPPPINSLSRLTTALFSICKYAARRWSAAMLAFVPIGIMAPRVGFNDSIVFVLNCLAIIPLADILCHATDQLSKYLGDTTGALVNITVGNATEVVIFIHALVQRQYMIVRTSLLGSIVVNMLLVLGLAIFAGEIQERGRTYNVLATRVAACLLCLATVSLLVPSTLRTSVNEAVVTRDILDFSRGTSIVLIVVYFVYLWTQVKSTKFSYKPLIQLDTQEEAPEMDQVVELGGSVAYHRRTLSYLRTTDYLISPTDSQGYPPMIDHSNLRNLPDPSLATSVLGKISTAWELVKTEPWVIKIIPVIMLIISTGLISVCGDYLVTSIDHFVDHSPISKTMVGLIILPLVGNAAELVSGIMFASRKQMDLAFAVSIGSAIQIALFVTPLIVLIGWGIGRDMSLQFSAFESVTLVASSILFLMLVFEERCSYLKAVCLCAGYTIIALASYFISDMN